MNTSGQKCGQTCLKGNGVNENSNVATTESFSKVSWILPSAMHLEDKATPVALRDKIAL